MISRGEERVAARRFIRQAFTIAIGGIIFFFALSQVFNKIKYVERSPWRHFEMRVAEFGGVAIDQVALKILNPDAALARAYEDILRTRLSSLENQPIWGAHLHQSFLDLKGIPWIKRASLRRVWPDRLEVQVELREAHFVVRAQNSWVLADADGEFFEQKTFFDMAWRPFVRVHGLENRLQGELGFLNRRQQAEKNFLSQTSKQIHQLEKRLGIEIFKARAHENFWERRNELEVFFGDLLRPRSILISPPLDDQQMLELQYVLSDLKNSGEGFEKVDGRFGRRWTVEPKAGESS